MITEIRVIKEKGIYKLALATMRVDGSVIKARALHEELQAPSISLLWDVLQFLEEAMREEILDVDKLKCKCGKGAASKVDCVCRFCRER